MRSLTEDEIHFGERVWVYCRQHMRPHRTGWCGVSNQDKILLRATNEKDAYVECGNKGYKIIQERIM